MKKQKWKPGMGMGDGHGRSGREGGLKGEWVKKSSPEGRGRKRLEHGLPSVSPHLLPSPLHLLPSTQGATPLPFSPGPMASPLLLPSLQIAIHLATQTAHQNTHSNSHPTLSSSLEAWAKVVARTGGIHNLNHNVVDYNTYPGA